MKDLNNKLYMLVKAAMDSGISKEEFRVFLENKRLENKNKTKSKGPDSNP